MNHCDDDANSRDLKNGVHVISHVLHLSIE
jgi:hypothetical protein